MSSDLDQLPERLADLLSPEPNTGCWLYSGRWSSGNGYGKVMWRGRTWMLHRLVWTLLVGPICPGLQLDHTCRCRWCSRPEHLDPCPPVVNTRRGEAVLFRGAGEYGVSASRST